MRILYSHIFAKIFRRLKMAVTQTVTIQKPGANWADDVSANADVISSLSSDFITFIEGLKASAELETGRELVSADTIRFTRTWTDSAWSQYTTYKTTIQADRAAMQNAGYVVTIDEPAF